MRTKPRRRREVAPAVITALAPLLRYSAGRDAYVLRGIGASRGPVLQPRQPEPTRRFTREADRSRSGDGEHAA